MEELDTLLEKEKYQELLELTENYEDKEQIVYHLLALLGLNKSEDALTFIDEHQEELEEYSLVDIIKIHLDLLLSLDRHQEAYEALKHYQELPYESQEVEELLRNGEYIIRDHEVTCSKNFTLTTEKIKSYLLSDNYELYQTAIHYLMRPELSLVPFEEELVHLLMKGANQTIRAITLFLMCDKKYDGDFSFNYFGETITVNPKKIKEENRPNDIPKVRDEINKKANKDITLEQIALELFNQYMINYFPKEIEVNDDLIDPLISIASKILKGIMPEEAELTPREKEILLVIDPKI